MESKKAAAADATVSQIHFATNHRIYDRNIPSQPLQTYIDARPVLTKYSIMPIVDPRKRESVPFRVDPTFSTDTVFNPGNDFGPWSGYASNVNKESELKNIIFALQECSQATYIPSSKSDLYNVTWKPAVSQTQQPFPELFRSERFNNFNPNPNSDVIGFSLFNNSTRQQLKDVPQSKIYKNQ